MLLWVWVGWYCCCGASEGGAPESAVRRKLAQAILSEGAEQQKLLVDLADTGSTITVEVLTAWSRDGIYLYVAPDGAKVPVLLEENEDGEGKRRALRVDDGRFLKEAQGADLRFAASDLNTVDTDMRLRSAIRQTLDTLALVAPDPETRRSAAFKLGNSQKPRYLPVLQARLAKEPDRNVRRALAEAIRLTVAAPGGVKRGRSRESPFWDCRAGRPRRAIRARAGSKTQSPITAVTASRGEWTCG